MTVARPSAALLAILAMAVVIAGCGSDEGGSAGSGEARALLEDALTTKKSPKSGELEIEVKADVEGISSLSDPLELRLEGPFKSAGSKELPSLDWDISFDGAGQKLSGGVVVTGGNAYLQFQGRSYELGEDVYASFARRLELKEPDRPLSPRQFGMDPASWLEEPKVEEGEEIGGDDTRKVTGSVDVSKLVRDLADLIASPAIRRRLEREGGAAADVRKPTAQEIEELEDAIKGADVELNVDKNGLLRRFFTEIELDVKDGEDLKGKVSFAYVLRKVGTNPVIRAPAGARPLKELIGGLGLGALGDKLDGEHN